MKLNDICPYGISCSCEACSYYQGMMCSYQAEEGKRQNKLMQETGFKHGDICLYSFNDCDNDTALIVRIKKLLSEKAAAVEIMSVLIDDSGNGLYKYLKHKGYDTNVSLCYLKKLDPEHQK